MKRLGIVFRFACIFIAAGIVLGFGGNMKRVMAPSDQKVVVIDPGHGGWDPGKAGRAGADEKDINLDIAARLGRLLESGGYMVFFTRKTDEALGQSKREDMKMRILTSDDFDADIFISIHQNSYPSSNVKGAQVFYYNSSEKSKLLAECIQSSLIENLDNTNTRTAKADSDYYILKNTKIPAAIIECGFLSNPEEEENLNSEEYRNKTAWAVYLGIAQYFSLQ